MHTTKKVCVKYPILRQFIGRLSVSFAPRQPTSRPCRLVPSSVRRCTPSTPARRIITTHVTSMTFWVSAGRQQWACIATSSTWSRTKSTWRGFMIDKLRWYVVGENTFKMNQLTDYYKYHKDIPRMFMFKICKTIHKFHDRRRRLEYAKIKGRLGIANDDHIYSESTFLGNRKSQQSQDCSAQHLKYMLRGVDLSIKHTEPVQHLTLKDILNSIIKNKAT